MYEMPERTCAKDFVGGSFFERARKDKENHKSDTHSLHQNEPETINSKPKSNIFFKEKQISPTQNITTSSKQIKKIRKTK